MQDPDFSRSVVQRLDCNIGKKTDLLSVHFKVPQQYMRENVLTRTTPPDYASLLLLVVPRTRFSGISWDGIVAFTSSHFRSVITCCAASAP